MFKIYLTGKGNSIKLAFDPSCVVKYNLTCSTATNCKFTKKCVRETVSIGNSDVNETS